MFRTTPTIILLLLAGGCMTAAGGGGSGGDTDYATYRMVQDMSAAVDNLNQTTAAISVRLDESDRALRELRSLSEENQAKLNQVQSSLDQLTATIYQQFGLTPPRPGAMSTAPVYVAPEPRTIESGEIVVEPPSLNAPMRDSSLPPRTSSSAGVDDDYNQAQQLYGAGDYEGALLRFAEHLRKYPQSPHASNAQYWKAHCHFKLGNYESAIEEFERLRSNYPSSNKVPTAMHNEAVGYSRLGQTARAEALFRRLIVEYPDDAAADSAREKLRQMQGLE